MKRAVIPVRSTAHLLPPRSPPANDNDPPEPPPVVSQRVPRLMPGLSAIARLDANRPVGIDARAA